MVILHIAPNAPYNDDWGYQDNLLPKYHKKLGHDTTIIVPNLTHKDGGIVETLEEEHTLSDGVRVIRKKYKAYDNPKLTKFFSYMDVYNNINEINPDFIFYHGLISATIFDVIKYKKKNPKCVVVQDNHLDYNIGYKFDTFKRIVLREWYRMLNLYSIRFVEKVYGVTPWRKTYAEDFFRIPKSKTDVLIMGADDEKIDIERKIEKRDSVRNQYSINDDDFLIVTGGKIDSNKGVNILAQACLNIGNPVKLIIFGSILDDVRNDLNNIINNAPNIINIGWIDASDVYKYFFAADLCCFPGQHSVLWEQACASKVPCLFKRWDGMEHVNVNGNSDFIDEVTVKGIEDKIKELLYTKKYFEMKVAAESDATDMYLYSRIAEKSLECTMKN